MRILNTQDNREERVLYTAETITLGRHGTEKLEKEERKLSRKMQGPRIKGRTVPEDKDNLRRNQSQEGKICWTCDNDGHEHNGQRCMGGNGEDERKYWNQRVVELKKG